MVNQVPERYYMLSESNPETIHVAYNLDDGYAEYTCVSIVSILANTHSKVHFHIISNSISEDNKKAFLSLNEQFPNSYFSFKKFELPFSLVLSGHTYLTLQTYYRLFLGYILSDIDRVIYLDCDVVINDDLLCYWKEDIKDKVAGVVCSFSSSNTIRKNVLGISSENMYFNAGSMILNLKKYRKLNIFDDLSNLVQELYKKTTQAKLMFANDQDVLNYIFNLNNSHIFLNQKYNFEDGIISYNNSLQLSKDQKINDWVEAINKPVVIHFCGSRKPWEPVLKTSYHWHLYYKYKALTPFYDPLDEERIVNYNSRKHLTETQALIPAHLYMQLYWRDVFARLAEYVKQVIGQRKLIFWGASKAITHIMIIFASRGLYPNAVVDGLAANHNKRVFEYTIQPAEILHGRNGEYFIVLCMELKGVFNFVSTLLKDYGYEEKSFIHAYAEVYEREEQFLNEVCKHEE